MRIALAVLILCLSGCATVPGKAPKTMKGIWIRPQAPEILYEWPTDRKIHDLFI